MFFSNNDDEGNECRMILTYLFNFCIQIMGIQPNLFKLINNLVI